ncbi:error-prone DNA polymerase [Natronospira proteinivora]|uniref:Error-prone DNA polymerase n=1 Tax=Natronospira proteinivora TaxID=1807133 RepID=A0ABT1G4Z1_9GAMM|nr:error-prone DNA polymerase [Natronospira proteinivora]MCP1726366.1 error-prone DNA polymerase [Natronospira proteinivora]
MSPYAELHCLSNFSFLRGASHPEELVTRAAKLGYRALAITDECSVAGSVRAHRAALAQGLPLIHGSEFHLDDGLRFVALVTDRTSWGRLCALITTGRRAAAKGTYRLSSQDVADNGLAGCLILWLPERTLDLAALAWLKGQFPGRLWIAVELLAEGDDRHRREILMALGRREGLPCVAAGDVHMHVRGRRVLQDTLTALRHRLPLSEAGLRLFPSGERHLRPRQCLARMYPASLLEETVRIARHCTFSLAELRYEYPAELVPSGETPTTHLRRLTLEGLYRRWPSGVAFRIRRQIVRELKLVAEMGYEPFFLTVHDVVRFARSRGILCQGRGSAANSMVCYCLGITEVDPARLEVLFERFISRERGEPPDIDVDFEHERREEVIQYIYGKYGRRRAALAATVITYRSRSAVRDVGRALGLDPSRLDRMATAFQWWDGQQAQGACLREVGEDPENPVIRCLMELVNCLVGFPRHLSQHVGGFVISQGPLHALVPVENAAMAARTVIQWDKDDLEALGLLKVDVLSLGMLTAIRRSFDLIEQWWGQGRGRGLTLANIPAEDPAVYDMLCRADTMGVFQVESRAQMSMLPRLKPRCFYDLVIEVAIVRPGPIQGDMVHPYLARRDGEETIEYPSEEVRGVLKRTLGVPIFQEQVMQMAIVAAGFTPGEADQLRRAMAAWKKRGGLGHFEDRLIQGMRERGYSEDYARRIFRQIQGFGEYGFPESHSASFALLVYVSAWLKCHEPAAFCAALLNSQPMGFYAPAQLVRDAREHGVEVRPVDVLHSQWECSLEPGAGQEPALRLGLNRVKGLSRVAGERVVAAIRGHDEPPLSLEALCVRARLDRRAVDALADAGALSGLLGHRHKARWAAVGVEAPTPLFGEMAVAEATPMLAVPAEGEDIVADYGRLGLTLGRHPLALLREQMAARGVMKAAQLWEQPSESLVITAGLVINRQRPGSARGVTFMTLEDESGIINLICWRKLAEQYRPVVLNARLLLVSGIVQRESGVQHVIARHLEDWSHWLGRLQTRSRDFQ